MRLGRTRMVLDVLLLACVVLVTVTGLLVDQLNLHQFAPHRWAGYLLAALVTLHLVLNRQALLRLLTRRVTPGGTPAAASPAPATPEPVPPAGESAPVVEDHRTSRRAVLVGTGLGATGLLAGWLARGQLTPDQYPGGDVGTFYHRQSSLGISSVLGDLVDWGRRPGPYKDYPDAPVVTLPAPAVPSAQLADTLRQRRSLREYAARPVTMTELAWVAWAATGVTTPQGLRTAPSAGALYPIETYVAARNVTGLDPGIYHVDVRGRNLQRLVEGSVANDLLIAGLGQDHLRSAPVVLLLTGLFQRTRWKYHQRHYRYVAMEAGHVGQNVCLAAEASGLGACVVGSFLDGPLNELLGVDGVTEAALSLIALGPR